MNSIQFTRTRTGKDYAIVSVFIIIGVIAIVCSSNISVDLSGAASIGLGIILWLTRKSGYKHPETGDVYYLKQLYFDKESKEKILSALKMNDLRTVKSESNKSFNIRLDLYFNLSHHNVYCSLHEYIPYVYEPCSEQCVVNIQKVIHLIK